MPSDAYSLFREATEKRKIGDIDAAIELLKRAKKTADNEEMVYTVNDYLRLPLYLQEAGKNDEAWREFQTLIAQGYPNQLKVNGLQYFDLASIHDKMRLYLQREGREEQAVEFGVLAYGCKLQAIRIQMNDQDLQIARMREEEAKNSITTESIKKMLKPLLKNANKQELEDRMTTLIIEELVRNNRIDLRVLAQKVRKELGN